MADLIGLQKATDKVLAGLRGSVAPFTGPAKGVLNELAESLRQERELAAKLMGLADAGTDFLVDADKLVEGLPEQIRPVVAKALVALDHFMRVGTRASNAAQAAEKSANELTGLIQDVRREGLGALIPRAGG